MSGLLWRSSLRYLTRHRWHLALSVLGVALGVAIVFSIDVVNESATRAFRWSTEAVTGRSTHHVIGGTRGIPDSVYTQLRVELGIRRSAPVVEGYVTVDRLPGRAFHLFGVDPFAEAPFRAHLQGARVTGSQTLSPFLLTPGAVYAPQALSDELGLEAGDELHVRFNGETARVTVLGFFRDDSSGGRGLGNLLVVDIASAQEILGRAGRLSRIDLIVPTGDDEDILRRVRSVLPPGADIVRSESRSEKIEKMTEAFGQNLFALSLLGLVVGMFLIYNTMTFSVVQRRTLIGDLRTLGVTQKEIFVLVLGEALVIGVVGTAAGLAMGTLLANGLLGMVTRTINDLYFVLDVRDIEVPPLSLAKVIVLGVGATVFSTVWPAREATRTPPRVVQSRSTIETKARDVLPRLTLAGLLFLALGVIVLWLPVRNVMVSFAGLLPLVTGFALLTPAFLTLFLRYLSRLFGRFLGTLGRMAVSGLHSQLSRSAVAIAALAIAVGTTVGVTTMVGSFRKTVVNWLEVALDADIYISPPSLVSSRSDATIDPGLVERLVRVDGVKGANYVRGFFTETGHGMANLVAVEMIAGSEQRFRFLEGDPAAAWPAVRSGRAALISEPYAYRYGAGVGDTVTVRAESGPVAFPVAGVYQDYASDIGTVMIHRDVYRRHWRDDTVSGIGLFLGDPQSAPAVIARINGMLAGGDDVLVRSNRDLLDMSIEIFDRTFAITNILRLLTIVVAFVGVLSALMALQLERSRELGVLRALGLTPGQLWRLVTAQTGLMGFVSGVIALPFGAMLSAILILVINKRSFGWTLQLHWSADVLVQAVVLAVSAALLAGLYPAYRMAGTPPALALREE